MTRTIDFAKALVNLSASVVANKTVKGLAGYYVGQGIAQMCTSAAVSRLTRRVYLVCEMRNAGYNRSGLLRVKFDTSDPLMETTDYVAAEKHYNYLRGQKKKVVLLADNPFCSVMTKSGCADIGRSGWLVLQSTSTHFSTAEHELKVIMKDGTMKEMSSKDIVMNINDIESLMDNITNEFGTHLRYKLVQKAKSHNVHRGDVVMYFHVHVDPVVDEVVNHDYIAEKNAEIARLRTALADSMKGNIDLVKQCEDLNQKRRDLLCEVEALKTKKNVKELVSADNGMPIEDDDELY